jgi:maltooligosyltrehalose trehalohydrolase
MPFGAEITKDGVRFALWAPSAQRVDLVIGANRIAMPAIGQGWYKLVEANAKVGDRYGYAIDGADDLVPDPASRFQDDDLDQRSTIADPCAYDWQDGAWRGRSWSETVLYEVHLGTATPEGTYLALADKLETIRDAGLTAIELMPLAETSGLRTWGYDGVLPYAPNNAYGTPDELKALVDKAHGLELMVFLDVVYNHFGPSGNFLHQYAASFFTERHQTPWGAGINFDGSGEASEAVREFFIQNALYWIEEFHIDGLRFDAVHAILDDGDKHFLDELAERIRDKFPDRNVHLVLENEKNEAFRLVRDGDGRALSYDAQWDDDIHHCWHVLLTGEAEGYYGDFAGDTVARLGRCLAEGFAYQGEFSPNLKRVRGEPTTGLPPQAFVAFLQNHDQIGNRAQGERLTSLADPDHLRLARAVLLLSPQIPMLFMGDDWGSTTPFQFFVNFENDAALEQAIREGRAKEFASFKSFKGADTVAVPDPTEAATFERCRLDWSERSHASSAETLAETTELLALRRDVVVPLLKSGFIDTTFERIGAGGLRVDWRFEDGSLIFIANFADAPLKVAARSDGEVLWQSETAKVGSMLELKTWTGVMMKAERHERG